MIKLFYVFANVSSATDEPGTIAVSLSVLHKSRNHASLFSVPLGIRFSFGCSIFVSIIVPLFYVEISNFESEMEIDRESERGRERERIKIHFSTFNRLVTLK